MKHCEAEAATTVYRSGPPPPAAAPSPHHPHRDVRNGIPAAVVRYHGEPQPLANTTVRKQNEFLQRLRVVSEKHIRESDRCRGAAACRRNHTKNSNKKVVAAAAETVMQPVTIPPATILSRTNSTPHSVVSSLGGTYAEPPRVARSSHSSNGLVESMTEKVHKQFQALADLAERVATLGSDGRPSRWMHCQGGGGDDDGMKLVPTNGNEDSPCAVPTCIIVDTGRCSTSNATIDGESNDYKQETKNDFDQEESQLATIGTVTTTEDTDTADNEEFTTTVDESTSAELTTR